MTHHYLTDSLMMGRRWGDTVSKVSYFLWFYWNNLETRNRPYCFIRTKMGTWRLWNEFFARVNLSPPRDFPP